MAAVLHLPLVPTGFSVLLGRLLSHPAADVDDVDAAVVVPIDLDLTREPSPEARAPATAAPAQPEAPGIANGLGPGAPSGSPSAHASAHPSAPPDTKPAPLRDPTAVAGSIGKLAEKDANVQVLVASDRLRKHELGMSFAKILVNLPEWATFFAGTGIDPLRDFDHLLIAGPRFKHDSSKVVAVMDYHLPDEALRAAVTVIVERSGGAWLEGTPLPAARVTAAGHPRIIVLHPKKHLVAILPEGALDQLEAFAKTGGFARSSKVGLVIAMVNPARPMGEVMKLPATLTSMRLALTPTEDGGGELLIELVDASAEAAERDEPDIESSFDQARKIPVPLLGAIEALDAPHFSREGKTIRAEVKVTELQLRRILAFASARYTPPAPTNAGASAPTASATAGTTPPPPSPPPPPLSPPPPSPPPPLSPPPPPPPPPLPPPEPTPQ